MQRTAATILAISLGFADHASAAFTVSDSDRGKLEVEVRAMAWATASGQDSVAGQDERIDDLFLRRLRFLLQAKTGKSLSFALQLGQDNTGSKVLAEDGSLRIKDAYLGWRAAEAFQVVAGQFKIPFLRANLESGFNQLLVDRGTLPTLRPSREGSRDLGAMAWGNHGAFQYRAALFDGSDQELKNSTSSLRLSGRLAWNAFSRETGLGYPGSYLGTKRVLQLAAQVDHQDGRMDSRDGADFVALRRDYRALGFDMFFEQPLGEPGAKAAAITVEGAWFERRDDYLQEDLANREIDGFYAQGGFLLPGNVGPGRLQLAVRREQWDSERGDLLIDSSRTTIGASWLLKGHDRKIQLDYTSKHEQPDIDNDEFRLSVVAVY